MDFALLNYAGDGDQPTPGLRVGDAVLPVGAGRHSIGLPPDDTFSTTKTILANWRSAEPALEEMADSVARGDQRLKGVTKPLSSVKLLAPILHPDVIMCAFANYTDHMKEMSDRDPPDKAKVKPLFFFKHPRSIVGPEEIVELPARSEQVDWEAELAVVIGEPARNVSVQQAMRHVAGYTIMNDLSLRDQGNSPIGTCGPISCRAKVSTPEPRWARGSSPRSKFRMSISCRSSSGLPAR